MAPRQRLPWVLGLAVGLGIGVGLTVGRAVGGDSFWLRMPVSAAVAGATALAVAGLVASVRWFLRKGDA